MSTAAQFAKALGYSEAHWNGLVQQMQRESNLATMPQVDALLAANWSIAFTDMSPGANELWQWKWRRPPRRTGTKGRLFLSTNQAFNALQKEHPTENPSSQNSKTKNTQLNKMKGHK